MLCRFNGCIGKGERIAVVGTKNKNTETVGAVFFQHLFDTDNIAEGFTHLFVTKLEKTVMHPDPGKRLFAGKALGLRNFIFVVREN